MTSISYVETGGATKVVEAALGETLMETAVRTGISGIDAECGGACACATCHVFIDEDWCDRIFPMQPMEETMLELASDRRPNSRLSCQIKVTQALDGLMVHLPARQG